MAKIILRISFILAFSVASLTFVLSQPYVDFCKMTTHAADCIAIIEEDSRHGKLTTPAGFCIMLSDRARGFASKFQANISAMISQTSDQRVKNSLQSCFQSFGEASDSLSSLKFNPLNPTTYPGLNHGVGLALKANQICVETWSIPPPIPRAFDSETDFLRIVIDIILEILNLNQCHKITACT